MIRSIRGYYLLEGKIDYYYNIFDTLFISFVLIEEWDGLKAVWVRG